MGDLIPKILHPLPHRRIREPFDSDIEISHCNCTVDLLLDGREKLGGDRVFDVKGGGACLRSGWTEYI